MVFLLSSGEADGITVSGTPGIGMSIFYTWFVDQYRKEFPLKTIICVSFSKGERSILSCRTFSPSQGSKVLPTIPQEPEAIYFFDGIPDNPPIFGNFVCFASMNEEWARQMADNCLHINIYMPVWDYEEMEEAAEILNLDIDSTELDYRFSLFGGCPLYCLGPRLFFQRAEMTLKEDLRLSVTNRDTM